MKKIIIGILVFMFIAGISIAVELPLSSEQQAPRGKVLVIPPPVELENELDPDTYIVGVGDQFLVENVNEQSLFIIPVLPTGNISIPGVAKVKVSGTPLGQALEEIRKVAGAYNVITLYNIKNLRIPIAGAVISPGIYSINASWRLSDLLQNVPLNNLGKDYAIEIRSKNETRKVNIYDFYVNGDLNMNPYLHAGESVFIPYADIENECISVYGPIRVNNFISITSQNRTSTSYFDTVSTSGLIPFIPGESLGDFQRRKLQLSEKIDFKNVLIIRNGNSIFLTSTGMNSFQLEAGDRVEFATLSQVVVSGHVNVPATLNFIPGHTIMDYISMAGGVSEKGNSKSVVIIRGDEKIRKIDDAQVQRGDIILVKRSLDDVLIGETSVLTFISMLATITATLITAYIASGS